LATTIATFLCDQHIPLFQTHKHPPEPNYCISWPIRRTFFSEKCDLNSTCVLCVEGKYYFQTYKYPYPHRVKTTMMMILVAVTTIFWVCMMNKLYYGC